MPNLAAAGEGSRGQKQWEGSVSTDGHHDRDEFRFDARYGRLIRKAGIGTIPFALFYYQAELDLSPQEVWLIGYVLSYRWTSALPFPAVRELARRSGVSTKTIEKYKKALVAKGLLGVIRRTRADGGNSSIGWDFSVLFERIDGLISRDIDDWARRNRQFTVEDRSGRDATGWDGPVDKSDPVRRATHDPGRPASHRIGEEGVDGAARAVSHDPWNRGRTHVEADVDDEELESADPPEEAQSSQRTTRAARRSSSKPRSSTGPLLDCSGPPSCETPLSPLIDRIVEDYAARLHDVPQSVRSNCTRARRIWAISGLAEDGFVGLLHEAYRRTQGSSHRIRKSAATGPHGTKNKMPYFFSVLRSLVEDQED